MNTVIHRFEHQVDVLVGAVFAIAQMFNCLSATEIANYADLIDVGYLVQVASNHATHESFQTTLCFLWSVMARCPSLRPSFYHHSILKLIQQAMVTEFESNLHQHHHVFLGSNLLQFTKNEMLKLFASVTIMHLADVDQPKLLENRCLDTLIQCMHQVENRKQLSFLMQFILQRLVKNLDSPVVYLIPPYPPKLTDLTRFHLTSFLLCSRCQSKYPEIQCYAVCKQTGQWIGGLPQQYKLCRTCISLDRHQYGFVRHQGQGKVWTVSLST
ncbi:hypothetical protein HMI54_011954 [Coelomomyces lativittatus]|nr:hypothetical protein HMI54_011954 [Coelomomyces lativittatus]